MADTPEDIDKLSSPSISENSVKKDQLLEKYKHMTISNEPVEILMDPTSSSVVTYIKPGVIEKKVLRYKDKAGNLWKEINKVVINEKQKVIFVEKRYKIIGISSLTGGDGVTEMLRTGSCSKWKQNKLRKNKGI